MEQEHIVERGTHAQLYPHSRAVTTICTRGSMAWKRISFLAPGEGDAQRTGTVLAERIGDVKASETHYGSYAGRNALTHDDRSLVSATRDTVAIRAESLHRHYKMGDTLVPRWRIA